VGVARRRPELDFPKTEWATADVAESDLVRLFRSADAVVHLAWLIQPSRDPAQLWRVNVEGSTRVFRAVADAGVRALVHASSVGAYSPGPEGPRRRRELADVRRAHERVLPREGRGRAPLDRFEREHPVIRVVRLRPALSFKRESASEQRRLFGGPFVPGSLLRRGLVPLVPEIPELSFQAVHSDEVGNAYRLAVVDGARGPFNIAAPPLLDLTTIARLLRARTFPLSARVARALASLAFRGRLSSLPPDWLDMGLAAPLLDTDTRAQAARVVAAAPRRRGNRGDARRAARRGRAGDAPAVAGHGRAGAYARARGRSRTARAVVSAP
ncbi:MAG TPA: NAD-dependent epimerase/dehydratase family protein, partial [Gaiellaceae bacterium]|nr:NAD-dependent epimerase/dehydratase family protein [Gaiellaceae bacterium]